MPLSTKDPSAAIAAARLITGDEPTSEYRSRTKAPMLTLDEIKAEHSAMKADVDKAEALLLAFDAEVQRIKADGTRHPDYVREKIEAAQKKAQPAIADIVRTFEARLAPVTGQKRYWQSKPLLLSLQTFDEDAVRDSAIRGRYAAEFAAMPAALLQLVADEAIDADNLPVLYQAVLAGMAHAGSPGWSGISLDEVEIPEQADALALIDKCSALTHMAHSIFSRAAGNILTGIDKMSLARQTAALR